MQIHTCQKQLSFCVTKATLLQLNHLIKDNTAKEKLYEDGIVWNTLL